MLIINVAMLSLDTFNFWEGDDLIFLLLNACANRLMDLKIMILKKFFFFESICCGKKELPLCVSAGHCSEAQKIEFRHRARVGSEILIL